MISKLYKLIVIISILSISILAGCSSTPTQASTGEYIDDVVLTTKIKSGLAESNQTSVLDINVESYKGVVQLSGFVDSESEKDAAGRIAKQVIGVHEVENNIQVKGSY